MCNWSPSNMILELGKNGPNSIIRFSLRYRIGTGEKELNIIKQLMSMSAYVNTVAAATLMFSTSGAPLIGVFEGL